FHWMNDREMRSRGLGGNHCVFVLELDGRLDARRIETRLERARALVPELTFQLEARYPRPPRWVPRSSQTPPRVAVHRIERDEALPGEAARLLERRVDGAEPWRLDLVRGPSRDAVVLCWYPPLVDAKGAERLIAWMGSGDGDEPLPPAPPAE